MAKKGNAGVRVRVAGGRVGSVPVHAAHDRAPSCSCIGATPRPHRSTRGGATRARCVARGGYAGRRAVGDDSRPCARGARATAGAARPSRRCGQRARSRARGAARVPHRRPRAAAARGSERAARALGTGIHPHFARGTHDRGPSGQRGHHHRASRRGDSIPEPRPAHRASRAVSSRQSPPSRRHPCRGQAKKATTTLGQGTRSSLQAAGKSIASDVAKLL
jgi:hypothetical protein